MCVWGVCCAFQLCQCKWSLACFGSVLARLEEAGNAAGFHPYHTSDYVGRPKMLPEVLASLAPDVQTPSSLECA